ncbi:MAG: hypothetical protein AAF266_16880, partial [Planctomycetota bacterium]
RGADLCFRQIASQGCRAERTALRRTEDELKLRHGMQLLAAAPKTLVCELMDTTSKVVTDNRKRRGFPWPVGQREPVDLRELLRFFWRYYLEGPAPAADGEDLLLQGASQELKDELIRERIREKRIANEARAIELHRLRESHLPVEQVRTALAPLADLLARARSDLALRLETIDSVDEARQVIDQAWEDLYQDFESETVSALDDSDEGETLD